MQNCVLPVAPLPLISVIVPCFKPPRSIELMEDDVVGMSRHFEPIVVYSSNPEYTD